MRLCCDSETHVLMLLAPVSSASSELYGRAAFRNMVPLLSPDRYLKSMCSGVPIPRESSILISPVHHRRGLGNEDSKEIVHPIPIMFLEVTDDLELEL